MTEKSSEEGLKAEARRLSIKEGCAYSVSDGFGIRNITPYALALGAGNAVIGLLSSIPSLIGNLAQLFTSRLMVKHSRKKIVVFSVFLQALMWLFILVPGVLFFVFNKNHSFNMVLLISIYTLLIVFGALAAPAWNSWMRDIVSERSGHFFGLRSRICGVVALIAMILAGFILDYFKNTHIFIAFIILFGLAFIFRSISGYFFTKKYEPELKIESHYYFSFFQFLKKMFYNNFGKFVIFISLMSLATAVASPFFAVYMLKELNFSYVTFMVITVVNVLAGLLFVPLWGKFADSYGNVKVIKLTGVFVCFVPLLWIFSLFFSSKIFLIVFLIAVEFFSGFVWAGFNLSSSNFIYDAVTRQRMALCISYFNILNGIGAFIGATLGGLLASYHIVFSSLIFVFIVSGVLRLVVYLVMFFRIKEVREVKDFDLKQLKISVAMFDYFNLRWLKPRTVG